MFILYFALWVVLNGRWTTEIAVFGLIFAAAAYAFSCRYLGYSTNVDAALVKRLPAALRYIALLLSEIVKANVTVMKMILSSESEPKPHLVKFDTALRRERHRVTLANSITLTPGTITVSLDENRYVVHCLDEQMIAGLDDGAMVKALEAMEQAHRPEEDGAEAEPKAAAVNPETKAVNPETEAANEVTAAEEAEQAETPVQEEKEDEAHEH